MAIRTFTCTPGEDIEREIIAFTSVQEFDTGFPHLFKRASRQLSRFNLKLGPLLKAEVDSLQMFQQYHQGGASFFWDGGQYGTIDARNLIREGDGSQTQFFIPNRYIGVGSLAVFTVNQATGVASAWAASSSNSWPYSLNATPGIVAFANSSNTIPASGHDFCAAYACKFRVIFEPGGIKVSQRARGVWMADLTLIEVPFTD
jgi:hypothetical protein